MPRSVSPSKPRTAANAAAVAHGREQLLVCCTEPSARPSTPVGASPRGCARPRRDRAHDHVGAEVAHELLVGLGGIGDHPQAVGLAQLHHVAAEAAGGARDAPASGRAQGRAGRAPGGRSARSSAGSTPRRRLAPAGTGGHGPGRHHELLAVGAVGALGQDDRPSRGRPPTGRSCTPSPDLVEHAGRVHPRHVRRRIVLLHRRPAPRCGR